ncbi:MAG: hypothetical protein QM831_09550 [Kofleriaceae bacterium]
MKLLVIALVMSWSAIAGATMPIAAPCNQESFLKSLDPAMPRYADCNLITRVQGETAQFEVVRPIGVGGNRKFYTREEATIANTMPSFFASLETAAKAIHMRLPQRTMIVLVTEPASAEDRNAWFSNFTAWEQERSDWNDHHPDQTIVQTCGIAYHYKDPSPRKLFDAAHQIFHCMTASAGSRFGDADQDWWAEGAAEHFASMVVPGGMTDVDAGVFKDNESASLFARGKDAVVFFDWYAAKDPKRSLVWELILAVRGQPADKLVAAMPRSVRDTWGEFEQAYFDHQIHEPAQPAHVLPYSTKQTLANTKISGDKTLWFTIAPFQIRGERLELVAGHAYEIHDDGPWTVTYAGETWTPPVIHTCGSTKRLRLAFAAPTETTHSIRITAHPEDPAICHH